MKRTLTARGVKSLKRRFSSLCRTLKDSETSQATVPKEKEKEEEKSTAAYEGPSERPTIDPDVFIEGCRALHKRTAEEGLCDACKRQRDWHEHVQREYRKTRKDRRQRGERLLLVHGLDGSVDVLGEQKAGSRGKSTEQAEAPHRTPRPASGKETVGVPAQDQVCQSPVDYSTWSGEYKHLKYNALIATYHDLRRADDLNREEKKAQFLDLATHLRRLGEAYIYPSERDGMGDILFPLPRDLAEKYVFKFTWYYDQCPHVTLWAEAHRQAMRTAFTRAENWLRKLVGEEKMRRDREEGRGRGVITPYKPASWPGQSKVSPEEMEKRHEDLLETHKHCVADPAREKRKREESPKEKAAYELAEKRKEWAERGARYFGGVIERDLERIW